MYSRGPAAAQALAKAAHDPCPPGYTRGSAGQLVMADHAMIYAMFDEIRPHRPVKRAKRPDGDL